MRRMLDAAPNASSPTGPWRRWLQFRLRTLLAVVTVAAAAVWAFRLYVEPYRQQRQALEVVQKLGGRAVTAEAGPWQRRLLGADLQNITLIDLADCHQVDEYLPHVATLPCLQTLVLGGEEFTDDHLRRLRLPRLTGLVLDSTSVSDEALAAWQVQHPVAEVFWSDRQIIRSLSSAGVTGRFAAVAGSTPPAIEPLVGSQYFQELPELRVSLDGRFQPLAPIRHLKHVKKIYIDGTWATDFEVAQLHGLRSPATLRLSWSRVSDAGLLHVGSFKTLKNLMLAGTKISDSGLAHLAALQELESLDLCECAGISDAGLVHLKGMSKLKRLCLAQTAITDQGIRQLKAALPDLKVPDRE
jgi:hypothetical protein